VKTYEGDPISRDVTVRDDADGSLRRLCHYVRHSPGGFSWGYAGSGPAELARCILIDHYGLSAEQAKDEHQEWLPVSYQDFKFACVAPYPQDARLVITTEDIEDWIEIERQRRNDAPLKAVPDPRALKTYKIEVTFRHFDERGAREYADKIASRLYGGATFTFDVDVSQPKEVQTSAAVG